MCISFMVDSSEKKKTITKRVLLNPYPFLILHSRPLRFPISFQSRTAFHTLSASLVSVVIWLQIKASQFFFFFCMSVCYFGWLFLVPKDHHRKLFVMLIDDIIHKLRPIMCCCSPFSPLQYIAILYDSQRMLYHLIHWIRGVIWSLCQLYRSVSIT